MILLVGECTNFEVLSLHNFLLPSVTNCSSQNCVFKCPHYVFFPSGSFTTCNTGSRTAILMARDLDGGQEDKILHSIIARDV
jgi:hypothetical protein